MEDKLLKILKIKIDAINRNIDNLNYLNGELERNDKDLNYIEDKLSLFDDGNILNFDNISKDDFEKILLMVNSGISDIFKDKTCNYDGIIYIIEGIRKSISLELTSDQTNAITKFIAGMQAKRENLLENINNLNESKNRLPETDLSILNNDLDKYNNIVSKFENKLYLTEIDEIEESLDFADVLVEEKADIYEFILKYNADIYLSKENNVFSDISNQTVSETQDDVKDFNYEEVKITNDLIDNKEIEENKEETDNNDADISLDDIKFNLDNLNFSVDDKENTSEQISPDDIKTDTEIKIPVSDQIEESDVISTEIEKDDTHELNTIELEDIIKKIDEKLKEMELKDSEATVDNEVKNIQINDNVEEVLDNENINATSLQNDNAVTHDENNTIIDNDIVVDNSTLADNNASDNITPEIKQETTVVNEPQITINDLFNKYSLGGINIANINLNDVDLILKTLLNNNLLDLFKDNTQVLEMLINNFNSSDTNELINLIRDNLIVKNDEFIDTTGILVETMPILFTSKKVFEDFKQNISFYKEKNINIINILDNYRELLIMKYESLVSNYNKIISYGLEINSDNVKYLLYNKNVLSNIDYYIEANGWEKSFLGRDEKFDGVEYIKKNPYKLNTISRDTLLKLRYTSENNGKIYGNKLGILAGEIANPKVDVIKITPEYLSTYFNGEYKVIDKNELKQEIDNLSNFDMTLDGNINALDANYKINELKYQFDNIGISRIKTIRIYNYLKNKLSLADALVIALTYNSVIKNDEYEKIVNIVNNIVGGM